MVSAVTKSGGNAFHGETHYYLDGSPLEAAPVQRLVLNPQDDTTVSYFQDQKQKHVRNEFGGSLGGPIDRDKLFFFGSISPRLIRRENNYQFSSGTVPGSIPQDTTYLQRFGKLTYGGGRFTANVSELYTPTRTTGTVSAYNGFGPNFISSSLAGNQAQLERGFDSTQSTTSGNADFWLGSQSFVSVRGGNFPDNYKDTGIPTTTSVTWNQPSTTCASCASLPLSLQQPTGFQNTPRALITNFDKTNRGYVNIHLNQSFTAGGVHLIKAGFGYQRVSNDVGYPGGYVFLNWGATFVRTGARGTGQYGYYEVNDFGTVGKTGADIYSLFIQDQWTMNRLTLNIPAQPAEERDRVQFRGQARAAPRGDLRHPRERAGKTVRIVGTLLRLDQVRTRARLVRWRHWRVHYRSLDTLDVFNLNLNNMPGRNLWSTTSATALRDRRVVDRAGIDPDLKPMSQDQTNVGIEYQLSGSTMVGAHYVHNSLQNTIEDIGTLVDGNETYIIGNPGRGLATVTPTQGSPRHSPRRKPCAPTMRWS